MWMVRTLTFSHCVDWALGKSVSIQLLLALILGCLIAGLIYTVVVFQAVIERSQTPHVHAHSTHLKHCADAGASAAHRPHRK